jgi:4-hydroxy-3-methylbut-2-enyl diphosphate reductase
MQVIRAEAMGMCFGVRDAIALAEAISNPQDVTIFGELVHNEQVNRRLASKGFEIQRRIEKPTLQRQSVMITAHGLSNRDRAALESSGKQLIDTTCPLVRRAHQTALRVQAQGWHVVIAGKRGHVEVVGLTGDLTSFTNIESPEEACHLGFPKIAVVCQTTLQPVAAQAITRALAEKNPESETRMFDTICRPTRDRQNAMASLVGQCDAVVVVGGAGSNNTRQLVNLAEQAGKAVCHIQTENDLDEKWLSQFSKIGLTAGTSTPDWVIDAVHRRLESMNAVEAPSSHPKQTTRPFKWDWPANTMPTPATASQGTAHHD